jgi:hypothetical protein
MNAEIYTTILTGLVVVITGVAYARYLARKSRRETERWIAESRQERERRLAEKTRESNP